jgi:hypothetical protein
MSSFGRDQGLRTVRRATAWVAGALAAAGTFAVVLGWPTGSGASTNGATDSTTTPAGAATASPGSDGAGATSPSVTGHRSTPSTTLVTPRSTPRSSRRHASVSSGGS